MASMGIKISLSNFGCTPDPLRYLSLVPASFVKLDSTILSKIDINQESLGNLHAMISALHELQIKIIAPLLERPPYFHCYGKPVSIFCREIACTDHRHQWTLNLSSRSP